MDDAAPAQRSAAPEEPVIGHIPNYGFMRLNWLGPSARERTLIVTGVEPADGAAIIGNAMRQMGVPVFFFPAGASFRGVDSFGGGGGGFAEQARKRTEQYGTWGARVPFRRGMVANARRAVDNPHMIFVMEDTAAIALATEDSNQGGPPAALARAAEAIADLAMFAGEQTLPTMILSVQKAREFAAPTIDALAMFCGITPAPEARLAAINLIDQGARSLATATIVVGARATQGALDRSQRKGRVAGWAKLPLSNDRVRVRAVLNGQEIGDATADQMRPDLVRHRIGDGKHGFMIDVSSVIKGKDLKIVEVYAVDDNTLIGAVQINEDGGKPV